MRIEDLPRGTIVTKDGIVYTGYMEWKTGRVEVYEDDGSVYRIPHINISRIRWDLKWKNNN